jgi:hypothetical protein
MHLTIDKAGDWRRCWGPGPLPAGADALGTVELADDAAGALIRIGGHYHRGQAGALSDRRLPARDVERALRRDSGEYSSPAAALGARGGRRSSPAKSAANSANALKRWHPENK